MNKKTLKEAYRKIAAARMGRKSEYSVVMKDGKPALLYEVKKEG